MNHRDKLLTRIKKECYIDSLLNEQVKKEVRLNILECVDKRVFNKIRQKDVAKSLDVSLSTIQRFERLEVSDLTLYFNYIELFKGLRNKKKKKVPNWVFRD